MGGSTFRKLVSCVLCLMFPASMFAADSNAAMLYTNGTAWVNGAHVPRTSSAIFSGDLLQTHAGTVANINAPGSTVTVQSDSLVQFEGGSVKIEHGGVFVSTSKSLMTTAGGVSVTPASAAWTEFNVIDVDGLVKIAARKGDVTITDGTETITLAQGQETTRAEQTDDSAKDGKDKKDKKKNKKQQVGAAPAAGGGALNSSIAIGVGAAAIAGVSAWVLIQSSTPASPSAP